MAGKTGTTTNYGDAWFVGWTPEITTAVWVGFPNKLVPMTTLYNGAPVEGGTYPAIIWQNFMESALRISAEEAAAKAARQPHKTSGTGTDTTGATGTDTNGGGTGSTVPSSGDTGTTPAPTGGTGGTTPAPTGGAGAGRAAGHRTHSHTDADPSTDRRTAPADRGTGGTGEEPAATGGGTGGTGGGTGGTGGAGPAAADRRPPHPDAPSRMGASTGPATDRSPHPGRAHKVERFHRLRDGRGTSRRTRPRAAATSPLGAGGRAAPAEARARPDRRLA